jgi:hypothetical protein
MIKQTEPEANMAQAKFLSYIEDNADFLALICMVASHEDFEGKNLEDVADEIASYMDSLVTASKKATQFFGFKIIFQMKMIIVKQNNKEPEMIDFVTFEKLVDSKRLIEFNNIIMKEVFNNPPFKRKMMT